MKRVTSIEISDGGDGSTFVGLVFSDGSTSIFNPDVTYDGYVEIHVDSDGSTFLSTYDGQPD